MPEAMLPCCCFLPMAFAIFFIVWVRLGERYSVKHFRWYVAAGIPAFLLLAVLFNLLLQWYASQPTQVYRSVFEEDASPDVTILDTSYEAGLDYRIIYLHFTADQSTVDRLVKRRQLRHDAKDPCLNCDDPIWWKPSQSTARQIYASISEDLIYIPDRREVLYRHFDF